MNNKKEILYLSGVISESQMDEAKESDGIKNYMFFRNLKSIVQKCDFLLRMNRNELDKMIDDGHDWVNDHISTSKDDVEEVFNWATTREKK
jgi:hypothetical protein